MDFFNPIITFHPQNYYFILKTQKKKKQKLAERVLFLDFYRWIAGNATELPFED